MIYNIIIILCSLALVFLLTKKFVLSKNKEIKKLKENIQILDTRCTRYLREYGKIFTKGKFKLKKPNYAIYTKVCRHWRQEHLEKIALPIEVKNLGKVGKKYVWKKHRINNGRESIIALIELELYSIGMYK